MQDIITTQISMSKDYLEAIEDEAIYKIRGFLFNTNDESLRSIRITHKLKDGHYRDSVITKDAYTAFCSAYLSQKY